jgi:prepilin signal peptidase PulO-like enzyme (type II secretory pathway)
MPIVGVAERFALLFMLPCLLVASAEDLATQEVPDWCSWGLLGIGLMLLPSRDGHWWYWGTALAALVVLWGGSEVYFRTQGREALGLGDVKLISAGALIVGPVGLWLLMVIAPIGGIAFGLMSRRGELPFAPFISYGLIVSLLISKYFPGG